MIWLAALILLLISSSPARAMIDSFTSTYVVEETAAADLQANWWLNSGAFFFSLLGRGKTVSGSLPIDSPWRTLYAKNNPVDTDNGYHPQNIFRLVTTSNWQNSTEQTYFRIIRDNVSSSPNRNASNGLLLFTRYQDGNNLYYAGVRVDGNAVIKKKSKGIYTTLAQKKIYSGTYDRANSPSLLPKNTWIGLRMEVSTLASGKVEIKLYQDLNWKVHWSQILSAVDSTSPITNSGKAGLRTDFMDVEFDNYSIN